MAATVISPIPSKPSSKTFKFIINIPTTVDGTDGATATFQMVGCKTVVWAAISSNFNAKTVELKASLDGTNFFSLAAANSVTASGNKPVPAIECGYPWWQISITGAPTVAMVVTVVGSA